jgi:hypothetical protein
VRRIECRLQFAEATLRVASPKSDASFLSTLRRTKCADVDISPSNAFRNSLLIGVGYNLNLLNTGLWTLPLGAMLF